MSKRHVVIALGLSVLMLALAPSAFGQVVTPPPNVTVHNEVTVLAPAPDPQAIANACYRS